MNPNEAKSYFIHIPEPLIKAIIKQLRLKNPPKLENIQIVVEWCVAGALAGSIFDDTLMAEKTSLKTMRRLKWELSKYVKELSEETKNEA